MRRGQRSFSHARLRTQREAAGLTQSQLAERVSAAGTTAVSASAISHYEGGRRAPDGATLRELARVLDVAEDDLLVPAGGPADPDAGPPTLRDLREQAGLTQAETGSPLGLGVAGYSKLERGLVHRVPPDRIKAMAVLFRVDEKVVLAALQNPPA